MYKRQFKLPSYMANGRRIPKGVTQDGHDFVIPVKVSGTLASPTDNSGGMLQELKSAAESGILPPAYPSGGTDGSSPASPVPSPGRITVDGFM